ncbi:hypothetical protein DWW15_19005, partial [Subdoligranulum sp. AF14-43]
DMLAPPTITVFISFVPFCLFKMRTSARCQPLFAKLCVPPSCFSFIVIKTVFSGMEKLALRKSKNSSIFKLFPTVFRPLAFEIAV